MAVTNAIKELKGVQDVDVNISKGTVTVTYDEALVTKEQMALAVEDAGYEMM